MFEYKLDFSEIEWVSVSKYARYKVFETEGQRIRLLEFSLGFEESDWCEKSHRGLIVKGRLEIDFSGDKTIFNQGDGIFIPPATKHKARPLSEKALLFLVEEN